MRTCVILIPGLSARLFDALRAEQVPGWLQEVTETGRASIRPVLPAVTMPVQATYTTGCSAQQHGVVSNGFAPFHNPEIREHLDLTSFADYRRNVSFWEQSTNLVTAPRVWEKETRKTAMLFVQSSMGGAADVVVTPKPEHTPDGKTISTCWSDPADLYPLLEAELGEFPLHRFWGPMAGFPGSEWIVSAARFVWEQHPCDLQWTYIPQLDYDLQRFGPDDARCVDAFAKVVALLTPLAEKVLADGARVLLIGEYGMTHVSRSFAPNVHFLEADLLNTDDNGEIDYETSRAFAMCDHQVAHIYCRDESAMQQAREIIDGSQVVETAYCGEMRNEIALNCNRAGEIVAFAKSDAWFEYRWWKDFSHAPYYAWTVDIHRKPGYDPTELFFNPEKKRIRADEPHLVKGSHGAPQGDEKDFPILLGAATESRTISATKIASIL